LTGLRDREKMNIQIEKLIMKQREYVMSKRNINQGEKTNFNARISSKMLISNRNDTA
jgi:hypothetical protein